MMRWEDERYVRLYTRDTTDWLALSWKAQGLFALIMRKVDRAGLLDLGKAGKRGLAAHIGGPSAWAEVEPCLDELLADGCVQINDRTLFVPNFMEAQEAIQSDKQRKRDQRERALARAKYDVLNGETVDENTNESQNVTSSHETGQDVTRGHAESHDVTRGHSDPIRAVPSDPCRADLQTAPAKPDAKVQAEFDMPKAETAAEKAKRERREQNAIVAQQAKALQARYQAKWIERYRPPDQLGPILDEADQGQLKSVLRTHGVKATEQFLERFMADNDTFLQKDGIKHALKYLTSRVNSYRVGNAASTAKGHAPASPDRPTESRDATKEI
jgi:hypothetical protein